MDTIIRTHVKTQERLNLLERTIKSAVDKGLTTIGSVWIVDDGSPMAAQVQELAAKWGIQAIKNDGIPSTKNGLYGALRFCKATPTFVTCDDIVFGGDIKHQLELIEKSPPKDYAMVSLFAAYNDDTRHAGRVDARYWKYPTQDFYAALACVYSPKLSKKYCQIWESVRSGEIPEPIWQDDLLVKQICIDQDWPIFNTRVDYVQHTGMNKRSFGDEEQAGSSNYVSSHFIGE